jgi:hypothetical protein
MMLRFFIPIPLVDSILNRPVKVLDRKSLMGWVCLFVWMYVTALLQHLENHLSKGNKGNRPERNLEVEAQEKRAALDISFYLIQNKCQTASQSVT